jgi:hypothetical protein
MHEDVTWPNGLEGSWIYGHEQVRAYWTRQWGLLDPHVEPVNFVIGPSGKIVVRVHQVVRDLAVNVIVDHMVKHIYFLQNGLIQSMEVENINSV